MTPEEAIRTRLLSLAALTALVGLRIYLDKVPQSPTYPMVRVLLIDDVPSSHMRGENALRPARVQVDSYAKEISGVDPYALAAAVCDAVHGDGSGSGLAGWSGYIGSPAMRIQGIFARPRKRYYDPEELKVLTMSQDYMVWFQ